MKEIKSKAKKLNEREKRKKNKGLLQGSDDENKDKFGLIDSDDDEELSQSFDSDESNVNKYLNFTRMTLTLP